jgi:type I restriction enzyme S subunit
MHVPEGWTHTIIEEHIDLLSGYPFKSENYSDHPDDVLLLRGDNIEPGALRWRDAKRWSRYEHADLKKYELKTGDFVIAMDRTWISSGLKVAEVKASDIPCLLVQRVSRIRAKKTFSQSLLKQIFSTHRFEQYVKGVQTETAVPHISAAQIREFPVLVPPLPEQQKIAQILSTWDKTIEKLEALIAAKQKRKKALMQQLLTGKRRFARFEGEWKICLLKNLGNTFNGLTGKSKEDFGFGMPFISYMNIFKNSSIDVSQFELVDVGELENQVNVQYGDIFFTTSSETPDEVGMSSVLLDQVGEVYLNSFCFGFRLKDFNELLPEFARYLFRAEHIRKQISILAQGATRYNLSKAQLLKINFELPSIEEQQKIAVVLSSADTEIQTHQKQLSALKEQKKGLMQQLLSGKKRVKVDDHV